MRHRIVVLPGELAIARLPPEEDVPPWAASAAGFSSLTRTSDELSIVVAADRVPEGVRCEGGFTALKLVGPFPFDQVGVLASITAPLAAAGVSLFAVSTFDTDYILVKTASLGRAVAALTEAGHDVE